MIDYHVYIPYVNRPELLKKAIDSVPELWVDMTVVNNSGSKLDTFVEVFTPPVPLSFSQSQNYFFADAKRRGCKFILWLHNDCELPAGAAQQLIERVRSYYAEGRRWGVAFTYYDIFSAVNLDMVEEVGGYDTNIKDYHSDEDFYHRVRIAGWETINTEIEVDAIKEGHVGSQSIHSDPRRLLINGITQTMSSFYVQSKWGCELGKGIPYEFPFDRPDLFGGK